MINFCFERVLDPLNKIVVPNLSCFDKLDSLEQLENSRAQLSTQFPYCDYPRLLDYAASEGVPYTVSTVEQAPRDSFYFVNINFFVEDFDYFARIPSNTLQLLQTEHIKILFCYSEADAVDRLMLKFHQLCDLHGVPRQQLYFVSHNTRAKNFTNCFYFNDDEILYNRTCHEFLSNQVGPWHNLTRNYKTTALVRTHKNWRAVFSGQLLSLGWPTHSLFSYCASNHTDTQDLEDCSYKPELNKLDPRQVIDPNNTWLADARTLVDLSPIEIDQLDNSERTRYRTFVPEFFYDSYWNIVIETHIDIENLPGVFITEKTWKPIAHYQPFVIMGCVGSLAHLRELGYKTFGDFIDESYDSIDNHIERTHRVLTVCRWLASLDHKDLQKLHEQVRHIVEHNRELLWSSKQSRIQALFDDLQNG